MRQRSEAQGHVTLPLTSPCARLLGRSSAPTHCSSTSGTLLPHCVECSDNNVPPTPASTAQCIYSQMPIRSPYTLPAVPGTILLSVADPQPTPRLITLRSSLPQPRLIMLRPCLPYPLGHSSLYSVTQLLVKAKP